MTLFRRHAEFRSHAEITLHDFFATSPVLDPIVACAASMMADSPAVVEEVISGTAKEHREIVRVDQEVGSLVSEDEVLRTVTRIDCVVTCTALDDVRARKICDDVVS